MTSCDSEWRVGLALPAPWGPGGVGGGGGGVGLRTGLGDSTLALDLPPLGLRANLGRLFG
jgi:hypothetical protein